MKTWPVRFRTERALAMGFKADDDFESVVRDYLETEGIAAGVISFVVPAYNEEKYLPATLASIHAAASALGLSYEIVVANDASTDATAAHRRAARRARGHGREPPDREDAQCRRARGARRPADLRRCRHAA